MTARRDFDTFAELVASLSGPQLVELLDLLAAELLARDQSSACHVARAASALRGRYGQGADAPDYAAFY